MATPCSPAAGVLEPCLSLCGHCRERLVQLLTADASAGAGTWCPHLRCSSGDPCHRRNHRTALNHAGFVEYLPTSIPTETWSASEKGVEQRDPCHQLLPQDIACASQLQATPHQRKDDVVPHMLYVQHCLQEAQVAPHALCNRQKDLHLHSTRKSDRGDVSHGMFCCSRGLPALPCSALCASRGRPLLAAFSQCCSLRPQVQPCAAHLHCIEAPTNY